MFNMQSFLQEYALTAIVREKLLYDLYKHKNDMMTGSHKNARPSNL